MKFDFRLLATLLFAAAGFLSAVGFPDDTLAAEVKKPAGEEPFYEVWDEEIKAFSFED